MADTLDTARFTALVRRGFKLASNISDELNAVDFALGYATAHVSRDTEQRAVIVRLRDVDQIREAATGQVSLSTSDFIAGYTLAVKDIELTGVTIRRGY